MEALENRDVVPGAAVLEWVMSTANSDGADGNGAEEQVSVWISDHPRPSKRDSTIKLPLLLGSVRFLVTFMLILCSPDPAPPPFRALLLHVPRRKSEQG